MCFIAEGKPLGVRNSAISPSRELSEVSLGHGLYYLSWGNYMTECCSIFIFRNKAFLHVDLSEKSFGLAVFLIILVLYV